MWAASYALTSRTEYKQEVEPSTHKHLSLPPDHRGNMTSHLQLLISQHLRYRFGSGTLHQHKLKLLFVQDCITATRKATMVLMVQSALRPSSWAPIPQHTAFFLGGGYFIAKI